MNRSTFKLMQLACMDYDHLAKHILRNKLPSPSSLDKVFLIHFYWMYELAHLKFLVSGFHAFVNVKTKKSVCSGTGSSLCVCALLCCQNPNLIFSCPGAVQCSAVRKCFTHFSIIPKQPLHQSARPGFLLPHPSSRDAVALATVCSAH